MTILFADQKLRKQANDAGALARRFGPDQARLIQRRLSELRAAPNLAQMRTLPGAHCHALTANRSGQWAVSIKHPYRLLFEPADDPPPLRADGSLAE